MHIDIIIDKMTPCLVEISSGKILQTTFSVVKTNELLNLQAHGWNFDWSDRELAHVLIEKYTLEGDLNVR